MKKALSLALGLITISILASCKDSFEQRPDVVWVPTPQEVVDKMIEIAEVKEGDVLYDLGCGDGRIVATTAKKFGIKAYGFDIDPQRIMDSQKTAKEMKVEHLVTITKKNIFELDLKPATVITLYLLPSLNVKLIPQLERCKPGTRIVSHDFDMKGIKPKRIYELDNHTIYLWVTPLEKE